VRLLGDLDVAEEAMHEAFAAALESWPQTGIPDKPRLWMFSTARFKAIDGIRRRARFDGAQRDLVAHTEARINEASLVGEQINGEVIDNDEIEDDRLRLITCCHPALPPEGQVALTLRDLRADHRGDCPRISGYAGNARSTHRARQGKDSSSYEKTLALTEQGPERQFLQEWIRELK